LLVDNSIATSGIVQQSQARGERRSTYDATVGMIIGNGSEITTPYTLPPRGVIWVISTENFQMPDNVTAVAALRTTWAHNGIFALNVGIIDPGYNGPVATALVNFSTDDFTVSHGDPFMRLMFFDHNVTNPTTSAPSSTQLAAIRKDYVKKVKKNSRDFSTSFLNMNALVDDVAKKIFSLPKVAVLATWAGLIVAVLAIFVPIAVSVWGGISDERLNLAKLQQRVEILEKELDDQSISVPKVKVDVRPVESNKSDEQRK